MLTLRDEHGTRQDRGVARTMANLMNVLFVQTHKMVGPDMIGDAVRRLGVSHCSVTASTEVVLPRQDTFDVLMVFGTPMSCRDIDHYPELLRVRDLVVETVSFGKPVLGVCFGCQLLAQVLGGEVHASEMPEYGCYKVTLTDAGRQSPYFQGFPETFPSVQFHGDAFDLPAGSTLLAFSERCPHQAYAQGRCLGLQFHVETSAETATRWAKAYPANPARVGKTIEGLTAEWKRTQGERVKLCDLFVENFIRSCS